MLVHFDQSVISGNHLITLTTNIQSEEIRNILSKFNIQNTQAVFRNRYNKQGTLEPIFYRNKDQNFIIGWQRINMNDITKAKELVSLLNNKKGVYQIYIEKPLIFKPCASPNDIYYNDGEKQWYLHSGVHPNADIDADSAWNINKGRSDVIIAVCDGGVDYNHPDLDPGNRSRVITGYDSGDNDNDPMDDLPYNNPDSYASHGTMVAGIIGALTNNQSRGIAGIMWNCKIMPLKMVGNGSLVISYPFGSFVWDYSTTAFPSATADVIDYAVNNGAHVINLSYGIMGPGLTWAEILGQLDVLYQSILNAYNHNIVITAAMGNEYTGGNPIEFPAGFREVIAVGQTDESLQRKYSSNTGPNIDVSAPGDAYTTARYGNYGTLGGTSSATPVVSGVAGLIISQGLDRGFNLTNDDVEHILELTSDDITVYGIGYDQETGFGKVNAFKALSLLNQPKVLYHGSAIGGTSVKLATLNPWNYMGAERWGLASGLYYSVDQYQITKHVVFSVPFCTTPTVWIRDRQCLSLSFDSPNDGYQWADITNITTTGFDVRYSVYYVRYDGIGRTLNKWVPASLSTAKIEYTAVGIPNLAATTSPISGPTLICSSSNSTFSLAYRPSETTVNWTKSSNLVYISGQGTNNYVVKASSSSGIGTIQATITPTSGGCGPVTLTYTVWVGTPVVSVTGPSEGCVNNTYYFAASPVSSYSNASNYTWDLAPLNGNYLSPYGYQNSQCAITFYNPYSASGYWVKARAQNTCGVGTYGQTNIWVHTCYTFIASPNPASESVTLTKVVSEENQNTAIEQVSDDSNTTYTIKILNYYGSLLLSTTRSGVSFNVPISSLKDGNYIIQISDGKDLYNIPLIVKH